MLQDLKDRQEKVRSLPRKRGRVGVTDGQAVIHTLLDPVIDELKSVIARVRYLRLAKSIREQQNPAIDADRQILLSRLQEMGFSDKLYAASTEIESKAAVAANETDVRRSWNYYDLFYEDFRV